MKRNYISKNVVQRRSLPGFVIIDDIFDIYNMKFSFKIKDVCTLVNGNLEKLCTSLSIPLKNKKSMEKFKPRMDFALKNLTYKFLEYDIDDAVATSQVALLLNFLNLLIKLC